MRTTPTVKPLHQPDFQSAKRACLLALIGLGIPIVVPSCASNAELEERLDRRNEAHAKYQERREIRQDARDERYNAWYDRVMH